MAANHRISSDLHDRYQGVVKAKESRSQAHRHEDRHTGPREEGVKAELKLYDSFHNGVKLIKGGHPHHQDKSDRHNHDHDHDHSHGRDRDKMHVYDRAGYIDKRYFAGCNEHRHGKAFLHGRPRHDLIEIHKGFDEPVRGIQMRQVAYTPSAAFSGAHLGSRDKIMEAHKEFVNAALSFLDNPNKETYKALTDSMTKLLDPRFTPASSDGAVKVQVRNVNGNLVAKFTMEVTPAATKTLDEAREDLKNAYSSKRDGEKDIADIRKEAYTNYIRALSEKYKKEGVIDHTNHTRTTPVFNASTMYMVQVKHAKHTHLHEIKRPDFGHQIKGKLHVKDHRDFWNGCCKHAKSYVDVLRHDPKAFRIGKGGEKQHSHRQFGDHRADRRDHSRQFGDHRTDRKNHSRQFGDHRTDRKDHNHHQKVETHKH